AVESGRLAAEAAFAAVQAASAPASTAALAAYDDAIRSSFIWSELRQVRDVRHVFGRGLLVGAACAGAMTISKGRIHVGKLRTKPDAGPVLLRTDRAASYPAPDGKLTFDTLSSVFGAGNATRDDQPNHIRLAQRVPAEVGEMWAHLCPA